MPLPADTVEGLADALRVHRLQALHRRLDPDDELPADGRRLPPDRRRLRGRGGLVRRRLPRGHLLAARARQPRRRLGRDLHRVRRGRGRSRRAHGVIVRFTPDIYRTVARSSWPRSARGCRVRYRDRGVVGLGIGGYEPGHPLEPYREGGRDRRSTAASVSCRTPARRPAPESIRRRSTSVRTGSGTASGRSTTRVAGRDRRARHRAGRRADVEPAHRRRGAHRGAPAAEAASGRRAVLDQHRRPGDVRHRPRQRLRARRPSWASRRRTRTRPGSPGRSATSATPSSELIAVTSS